MLIAHGVDGGEDGHDRRLVVAGRARVNPCLGIDMHAGLGKWNRLPPVAEGAVPQDRRPGRRRPLLRIQGLPIVMGVEHQRARRSDGRELAVHRRGSTGNSEQTRIAEAATLEHLNEMIGVATNVRRVACEVRNGEQRCKFADDRGFVPLAIRSRGASSVGADISGLRSKMPRKKQHGGRGDDVGNFGYPPPYFRRHHYRSCVIADN